MPEGDTILRETDWLKGLFQVNPIFVHFKALNGKHSKLDVSQLEKLYGTPIHSMLCKGKRFYLRLSKDTCLTFHHMMGGFGLKNLANIVILG